MLSRDRGASKIRWRRLTLLEQRENVDACPLCPKPQLLDDDGIEAAADQAIAACGGDAWETVKALIVANSFLEAQVAELRAAVSIGYSRGRYEVERDRKE
jgi:hypothetical protein